MDTRFEKYIDIVKGQEESLRVASFSNDDALRLGLIVIDRALKVFQKGVSVRIDVDGVTAFYHLMGNASLSNDWWMQKKMNGCKKTGHSSFYNYLEIEGMDRQEEYPWCKNTGNYALRGGCFPLMTKNKEVLSYVAVSGLPQAEDHQLVADSIAQFLGANIDTVLDGFSFIP